MKIDVKSNILQSNEEMAELNRRIFQDNGIFTVNLMGSPGAGKTSLLESSLDSLKEKINIAVIEGDLFTDRDAQRIKKYQVPVVQIETTGACHLDSRMVNKVLSEFQLSQIDLMIIENVGNLVCPAEFNLGEDARVVVLSVAEGDDKPEKYPVIFKLAQAVVINKIDMLELVDYNMEQTKADLKKINPNIEIFEVSCRTGEGIEGYSNWLIEQISNK